MGADEQVLVVERSVFDEIGAFQGLHSDVSPYLDRFFGQGVPRFMLRSAAETDPGFKQLIPYVVMTHGDKVLTYVRGQRAGETRLIGLRSIGIGGHINPVDSLPLLETDYREVYEDAVRREVAEEVEMRGRHEDRIVALLNDDSNEVGRVHLGVVHLWRLEQADVSKREQMITQLEFVTVDRLREMRDECETWSQLCVDRIEDWLGRNLQSSPRAEHHGEFGLA